MHYTNTTFSLLKSLKVLLFFIGLNIASAQQTQVYTHTSKPYLKALELYNNKQFSTAQSLFKHIKQTSENKSLVENATFYYANCAVRLNQKNADELITSFVETYPTSTKTNTAYLDVANYYFTNGKYAYASKWFEQVNPNGMTTQQTEMYHFNYGYTLYATKNKTQATKYLNRVTNSKTYGSQAKYYIGFMAYEGDDYDKATDLFNQVSDTESYKEKLNYYQADLNFKLGKFSKAIDLATAQLDKGTASETSELSKIIGESYFNLNQYKEAIPYLTAYKGKKGKWNNTDYYQLGYAYYKQNNFDSAIAEFNKIINGTNAVAQNAYYHLGESYINLNKKQEALNAFRNASQMDFDAKIKEDAWLNYAKLSYDIGNPYQSVPQVLTNFLDSYPKTTQRNAIEALLIDSYISSKNYKDALTLLEGKGSAENKKAYQKVSVFRGLELYNEAKYPEALALFNASLKQPIDNKYTAKATYWKAETEYNSGNFDTALQNFKRFETLSVTEDLPEAKNLNYNIAYAHFKLKNYTKSAAYFKRFISENKDDTLRLNDAYLRLADAYFVSADYNNAIVNYKKAITIGEIETDYATFQTAMSYGYLGDVDTKQNNLITFINSYKNSGLRDDAFYALANSYVKTNTTTKAIKTYDQLTAEYPKSIFVSKAILRQGLVHYNQNETQKALQKFKTIAKKYPSSAEATQAVSTARLIYIDLGQVDAYAAWVKTLDYVEFSDVELDNTTYLAAEKPYLDGQSTKAIKLLKNYLVKFPKGLHYVKANFYMAELQYQNKNYNNAKPAYETVVNAAKNEFTEQATVKLSELYLADSNWQSAMPLLQKLETNADYPQNILYAQSNLMKAYYETKAYAKATTYAERVLSNVKLDAKVKNDAQVIIARSAIKTKAFDLAKTAYAKLQQTATGQLAAEALYYKAFFQHENKNYSNSNTTVQNLAKNYSSYKYYSAKGLVLMAKNFYALDDAFQATYILESVITNFDEFDAVVAEASAELKAIKINEAKTNASVETEEN